MFILQRQSIKNGVRTFEIHQFRLIRLIKLNSKIHLLGRINIGILSSFGHAKGKYGTECHPKAIGVTFLIRSQRQRRFSELFDVPKNETIQFVSIVKCYMCMHNRRSALTGTGLSVKLNCTIVPVCLFCTKRAMRTSY